MNILSALTTLVTGNETEKVEKPDDSLLLAAKDGKNEKEIMALVRKAFKGPLNSSSRPDTREDNINKSSKRPGSNEAAQRPTEVLPVPKIDINVKNDRGFISKTVLQTDVGKQTIYELFGVKLD